MFLTCIRGLKLDSPANAALAIRRSSGEFVIDMDDQSGLVTLTGPVCPIQISWTGRLTSGLAVGGVPHQLGQ